MTEEELTPWFEGDVKPIHEGVYQTGETTFAYWLNNPLGGCWTQDCPTVADAELESLFGLTARTTVQRWRGFAQCPQPDLFASA